MNKFKLVIFGSDWDVYQMAFRDLIDNPCVQYIPTFRPKGLLGALQRIHFNPRLNHLVEMPLRSLWNPYYLNGTGKGPVCFLILENWLRLETGIRLLPYLKSHYPDSRIVCFVQDLVDTIIDHYSSRPIDVDYVKNYADLFISYDASDAKKHGLEYHETVYSPIVAQDAGIGKDKYDLFFLGRDKGRLDLLAKICREAGKRGLNCKFLLLDVPQNRRIACKGIDYVDFPIPYRKNLEYCQRSRCIVELLQHDASSPTFRTWETIAMNKKLLTNNVSVKGSRVYDERYISVFHDETDLDWNFVARQNSFGDSVNPYLDSIRPETLLEYMENKLNIKIDR